jgi:hypothetical protein
MFSILALLVGAILRPSGEKATMVMPLPCPLSAALRSVFATYRKRFVNRNVPETTSFWSSNVAILTWWAQIARLMAIQSGKGVVYEGPEKRLRLWDSGKYDCLAGRPTTSECILGRQKRVEPRV